MSQRSDRHSTRCQVWDYTSAAGYYVTICTHRRQPILASSQGAEKRLTLAGILATACWLALPSHFPGVCLDEFTVMPDHVHGVLVLLDAPRWWALDPTGASAPPPGPISGSIGSIVGSYKSAVTKLIHRAATDDVMRKAPVWHRNYHDRIIRDAREFNAKRLYTINNWNRWVDKHHLR